MSGRQNHVSQNVCSRSRYIFGLAHRFSNRFGHFHNQGIVLHITFIMHIMWISCLSKSAMALFNYSLPQVRDKQKSGYGLNMIESQNDQIWAPAFPGMIL